MVKTVTLTANTPQKVTFDGAYPFYWIDNKSTADVYASVGVPEADADGTYTVAAGSQMRISGGVGNDGITLLGEGKVQVVASAIAACPFKVAPAVGGGGGSDTVDEFLNIASTNPVQNRAIKAELDKKANSRHNHSVADISDFPDIPDKNTIVDWGFYIKLTSGIPKADLAADVQTSLDKAETALQEHQSLADYVKTTDSRLMSAEDKVKLDGIDEGANKTVVDTALNGTSENPISNKAVNAALAAKAAMGHNHDDMYYNKNAIDAKFYNARIVCGIYTGDGDTSRIIELGFTPRAVLVTNKSGALATYTSGQAGVLAVGDNPGAIFSSSTGSAVAVKIVEGGFQLCLSSINHSNGYRYHYIAFK